MNQFTIFVARIKAEQRALGRRPGALPPSESKKSIAGAERIAEIQRLIEGIMADRRDRTISAITQRLGCPAHDVRFAMARMVEDGRMAQKKGAGRKASSFRRAKG